MAYATFGPITFQGLLTPDSIRYTEAAKYGDVALATGRPRLQHVGDELTEVGFTMHLHRQFVDVPTVVGQLRQAKEAAIILPLTDGAGQLLGRYVITQLGINEIQWAPDGALIEAMVDVTAREFYDPNANETAQQGAEDAAFANDRRKVVPVRPVAALPGRPSTITSASARDAQSRAVAAQAQIKRAQADTTTAASRLRKAKEQIEAAQASVEKVISNLQTYVNLAQTAPQMLAAAQQAAGAIPAVIQAIISGDAGNAFAGVQGLGTLFSDMVTKGTNIENQISLRRL